MQFHSQFKNSLYIFYKVQIKQIQRSLINVVKFYKILKFVSRIHNTVNIIKLIIIFLKNHMLVLILKNLLTVMNNKQNLSTIAFLNHNTVNFLFLSVHVVIFKLFIHILNVVIEEEL